jgi:hypothetical protein
LHFKTYGAGARCLQDAVTLPPVKAAFDATSVHFKPGKHKYAAGTLAQRFRLRLRAVVAAHNVDQSEGIIAGYSQNPLKAFRWGEVTLRQLEDTYHVLVS